MDWKKFIKPAEIAVVILTILLSNRSIWLCLTDLNDPLSFCGYSNPGVDLLLYLFASLLAVWLLINTDRFERYKAKWRINFFILGFVLLCLLSLAWTVHLIGTIYHVLILIFTTFLASFLGVYFTSRKFLTILFWFASVTVLASWLLLLFFPNAAIMGDPHAGSWRGVFWHKNFTGSLMAFGTIIFLLYGFTATRHNTGRITVCVIGYLLSLVYTVFSKSAAGVAIWFGLSMAAVILFIWSKIRVRLTRPHYILIAALVLAIGLLAILNLDFVFGLVNRESTLTGRLPLWNYLISIASQRPILGRGFGAVWVVEEFQLQTTLAQGWSFAITNGHNGFIDILLGLGIVGFLSVLVIYFITLYRTGKYFINESKFENSLPFLVIIYFLLSNLTISFFLEFESFHWILLVTALFLATPATKRENNPSIQSSLM